MTHSIFLSENGIAIYNEILQHCQSIGFREIDTFELAMLANSFDLYAVNALFCKEKGSTQKPLDGGWDQVRPQYTVMKNEYANVLKHSAKFGMNPGDREKIFKNFQAKKPRKMFNLLSKN